MDLMCTSSFLLVNFGEDRCWYGVRKFARDIVQFCLEKVRTSWLANLCATWKVYHIVTSHNIDPFSRMEPHTATLNNILGNTPSDELHLML